MTEKKARKLLHSVWHNFRRLENSIYKVTDAKIVDCETWSDSPAAKMCEVRESIEKFSKEQVANLFHQSIREKLR